MFVMDKCNKRYYCESLIYIEIVVWLVSLVSALRNTSRYNDQFEKCDWTCCGWFL